MIHSCILEVGTIRLKNMHFCLYIFYKAHQRKFGNFHRYMQFFECCFLPSYQGIPKHSSVPSKASSFSILTYTIIISRKCILFQYRFFHSAVKNKDYNKPYLIHQKEVSQSSQIRIPTKKEGIFQPSHFVSIFLQLPFIVFITSLSILIKSIAFSEPNKYL